MLGPATPYSRAEFKQREQQIRSTMTELQQQASKVMDVISNPEVVSALRQDKLHNLAYLKDNHGVNDSFSAASYAFIAD
jgi:translation initiation factor 3 subunit E